MIAADDFTPCIAKCTQQTEMRFGINEKMPAGLVGQILRLMYSQHAPVVSNTRAFHKPATFIGISARGSGKNFRG